MTQADAADHLAGEDEPTVRWLSGGVGTPETVSRWIDRNLESWRTEGAIRSFGIRDAATDTLIGMVEANLALAGLRSGAANISYGLSAPARGRGYASRAVELMCSYLGAETPTDVVVIQVDPENEMSLRVPGRTRFKYVGTRISSQNELLRTFIRRLLR
jgi:RimJ/RimL family protein N-acetyltransferase